MRLAFPLTQAFVLGAVFTGCGDGDPGPGVVPGPSSTTTASGGANAGPEAPPVGSGGSASGGASSGEAGAPSLPPPDNKPVPEQPTSAAPSWESFFAEGHQPELRLTISEEAAAALENDGSAYQVVGLEYVDSAGSEHRFAEVGLRLKGRASARPLSQKAALKIKLDYTVPGQLLLGLRRLTLNNLVQDPSMLHERLVYYYYAHLGQVASAANHARVYVNDEYYGLFLNIQTLDEVFVGAAFPAPVGNLYDISNETYFIDLDRSPRRGQSGLDQEARFQVEHRGLADISNLAWPIDLSQAIDAVYAEDSQPTWSLDSAGQSLDTDSILLLAAAQGVLSDWDGFFGAKNNYKLYFRGDTRKTTILPWGADQTFGWQDGQSNDNYCLDGSNSNRERSLWMTRCQAEPTCWQAFKGAAVRAADAWDSANLVGKLDAWQAQIAPAAMEDTRKEYNDSDREARLITLRAHLLTRGAQLRAQIAGETCGGIW